MIRHTPTVYAYLATCRSEGDAARDVVTSELPQGAAPKWIVVFPSLGAISTRDGRSYQIDAHRLIQRFDADGVAVPIDVNHETDTAMSQGRRCDAVGWIEELRVSGGRLEARVDWLKEGRELLAARKYRFVSPSFHHDKEGRAGWLKAVALVTAPALANQPALASVQGGSFVSQPITDWNAHINALRQTDPEFDNAMRKSELLSARAAEIVALAAAAGRTMTHVDALNQMSASGEDKEISAAADRNPSLRASASSAAQLSAHPSARPVARDPYEAAVAESEARLETSRVNEAAGIQLAEKARKLVKQAEAAGKTLSFSAAVAQLSAEPVQAAPDPYEAAHAESLAWSETSRANEAAGIQLAAKARKLVKQAEASGKTLSLFDAIAHLSAEPVQAAPDPYEAAHAESMAWSETSKANEAAGIQLAEKAGKLVKQAEAAGKTLSFFDAMSQLSAESAASSALSAVTASPCPGSRTANASVSGGFAAAIDARIAEAALSGRHLSRVEAAGQLTSGDSFIGKALDLAREARGHMSNAALSGRNLTIMDAVGQVVGASNGFVGAADRIAEAIGARVREAALSGCVLSVADAAMELNSGSATLALKAQALVREAARSGRRLTIADAMSEIVHGAVKGGAATSTLASSSVPSASDEAAAEARAKRAWSVVTSPLFAVRNSPPPRWIIVFPKVGAFKPPLGEGFTFDADAILSAFLRSGPVPVRIGHAHDVGTSDASADRIVGLVDKLRLTGSQLEARVEWNTNLTKYMLDSYPLSSPAFLYDDSRRVFKLTGLSIVAHPFPDRSGRFVEPKQDD